MGFVCWFIFRPGERNNIAEKKNKLTTGKEGKGNETIEKVALHKKFV